MPARYARSLLVRVGSIAGSSPAKPKSQSIADLVSFDSHSVRHHSHSHSHADAQPHGNADANRNAHSNRNADSSGLANPNRLAESERLADAATLTTRATVASQPDWARTIIELQLRCLVSILTGTYARQVTSNAEEKSLLLSQGEWK